MSKKTQSFNGTITFRAEVRRDMVPVRCGGTSEIIGFKNKKGEVFRPCIVLEKEADNAFTDINTDEGMRKAGIELVEYVHREFEPEKEQVDFDDGSGNQHGFCCPACGSSHEIAIVGEKWFAIVEDGTDDVPHDGDIDWDDDSPAKCLGCGWNGSVGDLHTVE